MTSFNSLAIVKSLAQNLEKDVETLTNYLDSVGQPAPSFDLHSPTVVLPGNAPSHAHEARERILDHCLRLFRLTAGPSEYLANLQTGVCLQYPLASLYMPRLKCFSIIISLVYDGFAISRYFILFLSRGLYPTPTWLSLPRSLKAHSRALLVWQ